MLRFDGYTITTKEPLGVVQDIMDDFLQNAGANANYRQGRGVHSYDHSATFVEQHTGEVLGHLAFGGSRVGDTVRVEVKGEQTPFFVDTLRASGIEYKCTRVDSCADFNEDGVFDRLLQVCLDAKKHHGIKGSKAGDWDDFPEQGRTLYLGSPKSAMLLRLYEKGKQLGHDTMAARMFHNWVRIEAQLRPQRPEAKIAAASFTPADVWGASVFTRQIAERIFIEAVKPFIQPRKASSLDVALNWACKQYGNAFSSELDRLGGDFEAFGLEIFRRVVEQRKP